jgi:hypothetical protein
LPATIDKDRPEKVLARALKLEFKAINKVFVFYINLTLIELILFI